MTWNPENSLCVTASVRCCLSVFSLDSRDNNTDMPKKENIQGMFDNIAPEYDRLNHLMSLDIDKTWRKRALTQIFKPNLTERAMTAAGDSENGGLHVLDIACGTGDFSIAIAKEMLRRAADIGPGTSWVWTCPRGC